MYLDLNDSKVIEMSGIKDQHVILTSPGNTSCDVYSIQVTARNDAGSSDPSSPLTSSFPSLPDISLLEGLIEHSLSEGVTLTVMFRVPGFDANNKYNFIIMSL